jgi:hypothetical protein
MLPDGREVLELMSPPASAYRLGRPGQHLDFGIRRASGGIEGSGGGGAGTGVRRRVLRCKYTDPRISLILQDIEASMCQLDRPDTVSAPRPTSVGVCQRRVRNRTDETTRPLKEYYADAGVGYAHDWNAV